ncbi:localization factor PodJL [Neorhizobium huautlense]|uniref:Localization factor PodJL n=1 Tax=Neorhizobium huautlense TaxID=67774 RepID=A0ABT9PUL1_9HYPH|nr:peptidoglycan-binding protein [Neorhizobium huautlense]MDP9837846.1 localization factor PodJL [Neorhizobium huautlense]
MNGSRPTPSRRGETSSLDALNRTIEGLEARIEGLMHSSGRDRQTGKRHTGDVREQRRHAEPQQQTTQRAAPQPAAAAQLNPLEEIRRRQRALDAARHPEREMRPPEAYVETPRAPIAPRRPAAQPAAAYADNRAPRAESRPLPPVSQNRPLASAVAARAAAPATMTAVLPDAIMNDIAEALVSLRQDLKQDISQGVAREMDGLRTEIRSIRAIAEDRHFAEDMRNDLAKLAESIGNLNHRGAPETDDLREEFEGLRAAMQGLAREDTVQRMETQFLGLEERVLDADPQALREELLALAYRIDDIKTQLGAVGDNSAIFALEDKLLTLAGAVEQLGTRMVPHNDPMIVEQFSVLDKRLDEISRALTASSRASADAALDHGMIGRLESRLEGLADQIDAMHRDALQSAVPSAMDDEMGVRIEALARKIDDFSREQGAMRLDERLEDLAILMERVQQPAQPAELTGYLSDISRKIDALEQGSVNDALAERLDYISRRIEEIEVTQPAAPVDNELFGRLEGRLSDIAARLDDAASAPASDNDALRNLEDQIANLSRLISEPKPAAEAFELPAAFEERMSAIEGYMATSDEYVIEAARQAAEAVVEAYARNGAASGGAAPDMGALTALAEDLRHLEDLTRGSEERTHQTFEMLHRTLVSIADRLDTMEGSIARQGTLEPARSVPAPSPTTTRTSMQSAPAAQAAPAAQFAQATPAAQVAPVMPKATVPMFAGGEDLHNSVALPAEDRLDERSLFADDLESGLLDNGDASDDLENAQRTADKEGRVIAAGDKSGKSLLGGMKRFLSGHREAEPKATDRTVVEPTPSIDPVDMLPPEQQNVPLEPGSGMPDVKKILERVRASQAGQAGNTAGDGESVDYIAAARRAAKAAAMETDPTLAVSAGSRGKGKTKAEKPNAVKAGRAAMLKADSAKGGGLSAAFAKHRKPILLAVGAVLLALMAMPLVNTLTRGDDAPAAPPEVGMVAPAENPAEGTPATGMTANEADTSLQEPTGADAQNAAPLESGEASSSAPAPLPDVAQAPLDTAPLAETQQAPSAETAPAPVAPETATPAAPQAAIEVPATMGPKSLADAAASGDPQALFEIGARYQDGRGVAANLPEAVRWYEMAATRGLAPAQYRVANLYEKGTGVTRDFGKAMTYYEQAAEAGNASAMHNLAVLYASGAAGTPDYAKAVSWFEKAADLGVSDSQFNLAILYARGNGVPQNLDASYKWFAVAARGGDQDAAQKRDEVGAAMSPAQLEAAKSTAEQWQVKPVDPTANSVNLPDEWVGKGEKTASVDMEKAIRNIQAILNKNGFDAGAPDGKMGNKTVAAIRSFQKANGMEPDGKVSEPLVRKLLATNQG